MGENEQQGQQILKNFLENDLKEFIKETEQNYHQFSLPDIPVSPFLPSLYLSLKNKTLSFDISIKAP